MYCQYCLCHTPMMPLVNMRETFFQYREQQIDYLHCFTYCSQIKLEDEKNAKICVLCSQDLRAEYILLYEENERTNSVASIATKEETPLNIDCETTPCSNQETPLKVEAEVQDATAFTQLKPELEMQIKQEEELQSVESIEIKTEEKLAEIKQEVTILEYEIISDGNVHPTDKENPWRQLAVNRDKIIKFRPLPTTPRDNRIRRLSKDSGKLPALNEKHSPILHKPKELEKKTQFLSIHKSHQTNFKPLRKKNKGFTISKQQWLIKNLAEMPAKYVKTYFTKEQLANDVPSDDQEMAEEWLEDQPVKMSVSNSAELDLDPTQMRAPGRVQPTPNSELINELLSNKQGSFLVNLPRTRITFKNHLLNNVGILINTQKQSPAVPSIDTPTILNFQSKTSQSLIEIDFKKRFTSSAASTVPETNFAPSSPVNESKLRPFKSYSRILNTKLKMPETIISPTSNTNPKKYLKSNFTKKQLSEDGSNEMAKSRTDKKNDIPDAVPKVPETIITPTANEDLEQYLQIHLTKKQLSKDNSNESLVNITTSRTTTPDLLNENSEDSESTIQSIMPLPQPLDVKSYDEIAMSDDVQTEIVDETALLDRMDDLTDLTMDPSMLETHNDSNIKHPHKNGAMDGGQTASYLSSFIDHTAQVASTCKASTNFYHCRRCLSYFQTKLLLDDSCSTCNSCFKFEKQLKTHLTDCEKEKNDRYLLSAGILEDDFKYKCHFCKLSCSTKRSIVMHFQLKHNHQNAIYKCRLCPYVFAERTYLERHYNKKNRRNHTH